MSVLAAAPPAATASSHDVYGWSAAWRLPTDETCAGAARSLTRRTLTAMGLPDDLGHVVATVASELTVNAFTHAPTARTALPGSAELWMHLVEHPEPRLVVSMFDADRGHLPIPVHSAALAESGRGLQIVAALSAEWGWRPTRSRVGPWHLPGKTVWAAFGLPATWTRTRLIRPSPTPLTAAGALHAALATRGLDRVFRGGDDRLQVISVRTGLTVWVGDSAFSRLVSSADPAACVAAAHGVGSFRWRDGTGGYRHRALEDVADAAEQIISRNEELTPLPPTMTSR